MHDRLLKQKLNQLTRSFPIVCVIGPRQSGKTTLVRNFLPNYTYISLENYEQRDFADNDPVGFLKEYHHNVIIDEAQLSPKLFSYLQTKVDEKDIPGQYVLTGSAHLTLLEKLSQSLAGRVALLKLLPYGMPELIKFNGLAETLVEQLFKGFYPRIYKHNLHPVDWYPHYIQTYLEKDVREIINIKNLQKFRKFIQLCAGRHGQLLNVVSLSNDCGITRKTVNEWLSALEASFLIFLLPSFYKNYSKRMIKSPKLYFFDSGLVCSLLKIESPEQLKNHYLKGAIFEGFVISEIIKQRYNLGLEPHTYFWRDRYGNEIDCIIEKSNKTLAVEIKASETVINSFFKELSNWHSTNLSESKSSYLVYAGEKNHVRQNAKVLGWKSIIDLLNKI